MNISIIMKDLEKIKNSLNSVILASLLKRVDELDLSIRTHNILQNMNITFVFDLVQNREFELLKYKGFGRKSLNEIKEILNHEGLSLGMKYEDFSEIIKLRIRDLKELEKHRKLILNSEKQWATEEIENLCKFGFMEIKNVSNINS